MTSTTVPHFSGETLLSFNFHVDNWTEPNRIAFQQVLATFFNLNFRWNSFKNARAGPGNIEVIKVRMGEDDLGHRVPAVSVVHWRIKMLGYGFLYRSAEDIVLEALKPQFSGKLYAMLREVYLDAIDGSMARPRRINPPQCQLCTPNPAFSTAFDPRFPPAPYKCKYTFGSYTGVVEADAWNPLQCDPTNENYLIGPLGGNVYGK